MAESTKGYSLSIKRSITWINTPVLMKALERYQEGSLTKPMKMWLEEILEISNNQIN